jgi:hypothetical protein
LKLERREAACGKSVFSLSSLFLFGITENARSGFLRFFNLDDKTKRGEIQMAVASTPVVSKENIILPLFT